METKLTKIQTVKFAIQIQSMNVKLFDLFRS